MTTSPEQMSFLSEVLEWQPIPEDKLVYFRERLRDRLHAAILDAFLARSRERGFKQKDLAVRIHRAEAQITRWFSTTSNLTLDSISDLMVGLGMDFDGFPFTPIEKTMLTTEQERRKGEEEARVEKLSAKILAELQVRSSNIVAALAKEQERSSGVATSRAPSPYMGRATAPITESIQKRSSGGSGKVFDFAKALQQRTEKNSVRKSLTDFGAAA